MQIKSREELNKYLKKYCNDSAYAILTYKGKTIPVYFFYYDEAWFESECFAQCIIKDVTDKKLKEYIDEMYQKRYRKKAYEDERKNIINGNLYSCESFQETPWLFEDDNVVTDIKIVSEYECLKYVLDNKKSC